MERNHVDLAADLDISQVLLTLHVSAAQQSIHNVEIAQTVKNVHSAILTGSYTYIPLQDTPTVLKHALMAGMAKRSSTHKQK